MLNFYLKAAFQKEGLKSFYHRKLDAFNDAVFIFYLTHPSIHYEMHMNAKWRRKYGSSLS